MSPEQLDAQPVDNSTDQYSLAVVAYRMLTGCRIFEAETAASWFAMIFTKTPPPASLKNPSLPPAADPVLARAMEKTPSARYASCGQFVAELEHALTAPLPRSPRHGHRRAPKSMGVATGALLLLAVGWFAIDG